MPLDSSIINSIQTPQIEDPIAKLSKMLQLKSMKQESDLRTQSIEDDQALRRLLGSPKFDMGSPEAQGQLYATKVGREVVKTYADQQKTALEGQKLKNENSKFIADQVKKGMSVIMTYPTRETALAVIQKFKQKFPDENFDDDLARIDQLKTPEDFKRFAAAHSIEAEKLLPKPQNVDYGGYKEQQKIDPVTGEVTAVSRTDKTATPGERLVDARQQVANNIAMGNLGLRQKELEQREEVRKDSIKGTAASLGMTPDHYSKLNVNMPKDEASVNQLSSKTDATIALIDKIQSNPALNRFFGKASGNIDPRLLGNDATSLNADIEQLKGRALLDTIQGLKALSATGATGLGAVSNFEAQNLISSQFNPDRLQDPANFKQQLQNLKAALESSRDNVIKAYNANYGRVGAKPIQNLSVAPQGVDQRIWSKMSQKDRQAFIEAGAK